MFVFDNVSELIKAVEKERDKQQETLETTGMAKAHRYLSARGAKEALNTVLDFLRDFEKSEGSRKPVPGSEESEIHTKLTKCDTGLGTHWVASPENDNSGVFPGPMSTGRTPEEAIGRLYTEHLYNNLSVRNE